VAEAAPHSRAVRQSCGLCYRGITDTVAPSPTRSQACRKRDAQRVLAHKEERLAGGAIWRARRRAKTTALAFVSPITQAFRSACYDVPRICLLWPWPKRRTQPRPGLRGGPASLLNQEGATPGLTRRNDCQVPEMVNYNSGHGRVGDEL